MERLLRPESELDELDHDHDLQQQTRGEETEFRFHGLRPDHAQRHTAGTGHRLSAYESAQNTPGRQRGR